MFVCVALILIVLLQAGKGADMGVSFGGGSSQALLGSSGDTPMIGKITTAIAVIFMLTSLSLAYMSGHPKSKSVMDKAAQTKTQTENTPVKTEAHVTETKTKDAEAKTDVNAGSDTTKKSESQPAPVSTETDKK